MPKQTERGTLWNFQHPSKLKGRPFGGKISKKSLAVPGMICYAGKQEKTFWFSSLGQMEQFDTIVFGRTSKNCFGQFVWIEKKEKKSRYNSRVSLHEAQIKK